MKENYHDSSVFKLDHVDSESLILGVATAEQKRYHFRFSKVIGWVFSPFETQNILFDFNVYPHDKIPDYIYEEYEITANYRKVLNDDDSYSLGILNPSTGLGGFIIFKELAIEPI